MNASTSTRMSVVHQRRATRGEALRQLLSDGNWHTSNECLEAGGARFGARLFSLHHDEHHPLHYEKRCTGWDIFQYRQTDKRGCTECRHPRESPAAKIRALEAENDRLRARLLDMEDFS